MLLNNNKMMTLIQIQLKSNKLKNLIFLRVPSIIMRTFINFKTILCFWQCKLGGYLMILTLCSNLLGNPIINLPSPLQIKLTYFLLFFAENTGKLHVTNMKVPDPFIFGSSTDLYCNYTWDRVDLIKAPRKIYSIKWYKENLEFFRYGTTKGHGSSANTER